MEADNASINTNKDDVNPTRTNREIRNILIAVREEVLRWIYGEAFRQYFHQP